MKFCKQSDIVGFEASLAKENILHMNVISTSH